MKVEVVVLYQNGIAVWDNGEPGPVKRQIPWDAGDAKTEAQALAIAESVYEQRVPGSRSYEVNAAFPDYWPQIGDGVTTADLDGVTPVTSRITTRRVSIRDGGYALSQPTLGSPSEELLARQQIALRRQSNSLQSPGTTPLVGQLSGSFITGRMSAPSLTEWAFDGIGEEWGSIYEVTEDVVIPKFMVRLDTRTTDPTTVTPTTPVSATTLAHPLTVFVLQTPPRPNSIFLTIPAGESEWSVITGVYAHAGDKLQAVITDIGANDIADLEFKKLTVQMQAAPGLMVRRDPVEA